MIILRIDTKKLLYFVLVFYFIVSQKRAFLTGTTTGLCKDYWPRYCKIIKESCIIHRRWMRKYCPHTCEMCTQSSQVNPCQHHRCLYHSRCIATKMHTPKCLCQNLFDCPKQHLFVCGTDRVTYRSNCTLRAIACRLQKNVRVHSIGFCKFPCAHVRCQNFAECRVSSQMVGKCKCPSYKQCSSIPRPICGRNGATYFNQCFWKVRSCQENRKIPIARRGRCAASQRLQALKTSGEPRKRFCRWNFCPYYMICREVNGYPTCVKICPESSCSCVNGVEYYQHRNGCFMCRCKAPFHTRASRR